MNPFGVFPRRRMRRMRRDAFSRRLMREHRLTTADLIYPVFVIEGRNRAEPVASMPGVRRYTLDRLLPHAEHCLKLGIPALAVFPFVAKELKTADGREATNPKGLVPRAVAALKRHHPELGLITDVALDPYTTHGQDGVIDFGHVSQSRVHTELPLWGVVGLPWVTDNPEAMQRALVNQAPAADIDPTTGASTTRRSGAALCAGTSSSAGTSRHGVAWRRLARPPLPRPRPPPRCSTAI